MGSNASQKWQKAHNLPPRRQELVDGQRALSIAAPQATDGYYMYWSAVGHAQTPYTGYPAAWSKNSKQMFSNPTLIMYMVPHPAHLRGLIQ